MGMFRRSSQSQPARLIPEHLLASLPQVGITYFRDFGVMDVSDFYLPGFLRAGSPIHDPEWSRFVDQFVSELNAAAQKQGSWAKPGAFHVAKDFVKSEDWAKPELVLLMDDALRFLASQGASSAAIPQFALGRWLEIRTEH